jgi:hypothetical protein
MWRAVLADGRVVEYDGTNSPQPFLDQIIEFQIIRNGAVIVRLLPDKGERVIFRRRNEGFNQFTTSYIVGLVNLEHGLASLCELGEDGVLKIGFVSEVQFTPAEMA